MHKKSPLIIIFLAIATLAIQLFGSTTDVNAATSITLSPLHQMKVLVPGKTEIASFIISNPAQNDEPLNYEVLVRPFSVTDENEVNFEEKENYSKIVDWITIISPEGSIEPNESTEIAFSIDVPNDAPAGGQYASIIVRPKPVDGGMITEIFEMAHLVYAEVAGETTRSGAISDPTVPSFLTSGNIFGGATVENKGNVHSNVIHILRIMPLFGDEELFTNEENPQGYLIMPSGKRYTSITWGKTPSIGIFRVIYSVEFEGVKKEVNKLVIVCPLWLLLLIFLVLFLIIFKILWGKKKEKK